jgi:hypothetical protein
MTDRTGSFAAYAFLGIEPATCRIVASADSCPSESVVVTRPKDGCARTRTSFSSSTRLKAASGGQSTA